MHISSFPNNMSSSESTHRFYIQFILKYGGRTIPFQALRAFKGFTPEQLEQPGTRFVICTIRTEAGINTVGLCYICDYGDQACFVVVHPLYRGYNIGSRLLTTALADLERISCKAPIDDLPSLHMCFNAGLIATQFIEGPTGKDTLVFEKRMLPNEPDINCATSVKEGELHCLSPS
ncbi:GNAT family N-acetyltransferase [Paenibacillus sediminis]|uniref:GNAT superfamily N-acetyltransferase n=1 Tax=Paenibacillus sediminis TaxID=664909 RepID=A0ABS4H5R7_9BACL|nr:GNAT family N-acetyltransferase [Paenibacillus sediminis]MBP1937826.1 GNAT superfamily N-acetyltransferase [Paenibacillus sediminis]